MPVVRMIQPSNPRCSTISRCPVRSIISDRFLDAHPVDVVIVVDDLASTMAAAIVTKKRGIRLAHLVAGTRSFNINMPKEINRLVINALSDYLFTAGVRSTGIATREQSENSQTYMVGNILMDTLRFNYNRFCRPAALPDLQEGSYIVFTLNRKALMADTENLALMLQAMTEAAGDTPIIAPLRGLARETVQKLGAGVQIIEPLSYLEFGWLTAHAKGVITDSGNVSEEATFNSVPCITLNNYTEHQETVSVGSNVLVGEDAGKLREAVGQMVRGEWKKCALPHGRAHCADSVKLIIFCLYLEVSLRMVTYGAYFRSLLTNHDMTAIGTLPDHVAILREHPLLLDVVEQFTIAGLVLSLNLSHALKLPGNIVEALLTGLLGHAGIHIRPLEILTGSGSL